MLFSVYVHSDASGNDLIWTRRDWDCSPFFSCVSEAIVNRRKGQSLSHSPRPLIGRSGSRPDKVRVSGEARVLLERQKWPGKPTQSHLEVWEGREEFLSKKEHVVLYWEDYFSLW